jgi:hypothetical protein
MIGRLLSDWQASAKFVSRELMRADLLAPSKWALHAPTRNRDQEEEEHPQGELLHIGAC